MTPGLCLIFLQVTDSIPRFHKHASEGFPCSDAAKDLCISGHCAKIGCDLKLNSEAEVDICGICQGWRNIHKIFDPPSPGGRIGGHYFHTWCPTVRSSKTNTHLNSVDLFSLLSESIAIPTILNYKILS